jgi:hypothetical protein
MPGRAGVIVVVALLTAAVGCGASGDDNSSKPKPRAGDVTARAAQFAECVRKSDYRVVRPKPPNERADFLHEEGFEFAEVDLEELPLLFFAAIVDFFPNRSQAARARDRIASSLFGPPPVRTKNVVVAYTDEPGTSKRRQVEKVVTGCLGG